jgi:hypothetical protein
MMVFPFDETFGDRTDPGRSNVDDAVRSPNWGWADLV